MSDLSNQLVIDDSNFHLHLQGAPGAGLCGTTAPPGGYRSVQPFNIPLLPRSEWPERIAFKERTKTRLSDVISRGDRGREIPHLDQNGQGFCWAYSTGSAITVARAVANMPYKRLSPHAVACKIKNFRDEGGWNPLSVEFAIKNGYPTIETWPEQSMSRSHDNQRTWDEAKQFRISEAFMDLAPAVWDRNLTFDQLMTCLLLNIPCPVDLMWWRHSVCALDPIEADASLPLHDINRWGIGIWNSWRGWGRNSYGVIKGKKAVPDGATAVKVVTA